MLYFFAISFYNGIRSDFMNLNERIANDMKEAMKTGDKFSLSVLRMLKSAIQLEKISLKRDLTDDEVMVVIKRNVKQRKDSIEEFKKYNKEDAISTTEKEIEILTNYLPEELSEQEIMKILDETFSELNPTSIKDMGRVMKELTAKIGSRADMGFVSKLVKERLN